MHAAVLLALVAASGPGRVEPERIVRVQLLPDVAESAPGPKAPEVAASRPAPRPLPPARPKAVAKPPAPKLPARKPVARAAVAPVPTPDPVASVPEEAMDAAPAEATDAAPAEATAGAPAEAQAGRGVAAVSSAPPGGAGGRGPGGGNELAAYVARVRALLAREQRYPALARRRGLEGEVLLRLRIGADGRVEDAHAEGAAPQLFARSAIDAIERVGRLPAPPSGALSIEVPMRFRLEED